MHGVKLHLCQVGLQRKAAVRSPMTASLPVAHCRNLFLVTSPEKEQTPFTSFKHLASEEVGQQATKFD